MISFERRKWGTISPSHVTSALEKSTLIADGQFELFIQWLNWKFDSVIKESCLNTNRLREIYQIVRIHMQMFQFSQSHFQDLLWNQPRETIAECCENDIKKLVLISVNNLISILKNESMLDDVRLLSGTAIVKLLHTSPQPVLTFCHLIYNIDKDTFEFNSHMVHKQLSLTVDEYKNSFTLLCLINGLLSCGHTTILLSESPVTNDLIFKDVFHWINAIMKSTPNKEFHTFHCLNHWFKFAKENLQTILSLKSEPWFSKDEEIACKTLELVWSNWESPVPGVMSYVVDIFDILLQLNLEEHIGNNGKLSEVLLGNVLAVPLNVKGKLKLLPCLIKLLGVNKVLNYNKDVPLLLLNNLSTNYLASAATDVYKASLQSARNTYNDEDLQIHWITTWLPVLLKGLQSKQQLLRQKTVNYWLPLTIKVLPITIVTTILATIEEATTSASSQDNKNMLLLAKVSVLKVARRQGFKTDLDLECVREALFHHSDDIRCEAIGVICHNTRKPEGVNDAELQLIRDFLPYNLNIDSASFRHSLHVAVKSFLIRLREDIITTWRQVRKSTDYEVKFIEAAFKSLDFLYWLKKLCLANLFPGSCYQRRTTCVNLLKILYDIFVGSTVVNSSKEIVPVEMSVILRLAKKHGILYFCCPMSARVLLTCLTDYIHEIRENAYNLLVLYFTWPLTVAGCTGAQLTHYTVQHMLHLCCSSKSLECEAGATLCKLVYEKFILDQKLIFNIKRNNGILNVITTDEVNTCKTRAGLSFLNTLVSLLKDCIREADSNMLSAARSHPTHGIVLAIGRCLTEIDWYDVLGEKYQWSCLINDLVDSSVTVINHMMYILSLKSDYDVSPSFAEMGEAIDTLVGQEAGLMESSLSEEHQSVLSWAWLNIKECGMLLGKLGECDHLYQNEILTEEQIMKMVDVFVVILTKCRHRGVIEGCYVGFHKLCVKLLKEDNRRLNTIPGNKLDQVLSMLTTTRSQSNITRRSAGLPLIVQSICSSEVQTKLTTLLDRSVTKLMEVANIPIKETDQKLDLPQVHTHHIMRSLFSDAALREPISQYIGQATILCITGFSSSIWAVRNAATQLFGTVLSRIFGQKKTKEEAVSQNSMATNEFVSKYPQLRVFMFDQLTMLSREGMSGLLQPQYFPILIILSKLRSGDQEHDSFQSDFLPVVQELCGSAVYSVRSLAAHAIVPLIANTSITEYMVQTVDSFSGLKKTNVLHGTLLRVEVLLKVSGRCPLDGVRLGEAMLANSSLLRHPCCIIRAKYLEVLQLLLGYIDETNVKEKLVNVIDGVRQSDTIGVCILQEKIVLFRLSALLKTGHLESHESAVLKYLVCEEYDTRVNCLRHLLEVHEPNSQVLIKWHNIQIALLKLIVDETDFETLQLCMEIVVKVANLPEVQHNVSLSRKLDEIYSTSSSLSGLAVIVQGLLLEERISTDSSDLCDKLSILEWCQHIHSLSTPTKSVTNRTHAACGLGLSGATILEYISTFQNSHSPRIILSLIEASKNLFYDEDTDVRDEMQKFLSKIPRKQGYVQYKCVHTNYGLEILLAYIMEKHSKSQSIVESLGDSLYPMSIMDVLRDDFRSKKLFEQEEANIYFEVSIVNSHIFEQVADNARRNVLKVDIKWLVNRATRLEVDFRNLRCHLDKTEDNPVFNITCRPKVYSSIKSAILFARLLVLLDNESISTVSLSEQLKHLETCETILLYEIV